MPLFATPIDYFSVVWLECSKKLCQELERIQNNGMCIILSISHLKLLARGFNRQILGWKTLEKRRQLMIMALVHGCVTGQAPITISTCALVKTNAQIGS